MAYENMKRCLLEVHKIHTKLQKKTAKRNEEILRQTAQSIPDSYNRSEFLASR